MYTMEYTAQQQKKVKKKSTKHMVHYILFLFYVFVTPKINLKSLLPRQFCA